VAHDLSSESVAEVQAALRRVGRPDLVDKIKPQPDNMQPYYEALRVLENANESSAAFGIAWVLGLGH
jgi:hypothetical protein